MNLRTRLKNLEEMEKALVDFEQEVGPLPIVEIASHDQSDLLKAIRIDIQKSTQATQAIAEERIKLSSRESTSRVVSSNPAITLEQLQKKEKAKSKVMDRLKKASTLIEKKLESVADKAGSFAENLAEKVEETIAEKKLGSKKQKVIEEESNNIMILNRLEQVEIRIHALKTKTSGMLESINSQDAKVQEQAYRELLKMQHYLKEKGTLFEELESEKNEINYAISEYEILEAQALLDKLNSTSESAEDRASAHQKLSKLQKKWSSGDFSAELEDSKPEITESITKYEAELHAQGPALSDNMERDQQQEADQREVIKRAEEEKARKLKELIERMQKIEQKVTKNVEKYESDAAEAANKATLKEEEIFQKMGVWKETVKLQEETKQAELKNVEEPNNEKFTSCIASLSKTLSKCDTMLLFLKNDDTQEINPAEKINDSLQEAEKIYRELRKPYLEIKALLNDKSNVFSKEHREFLGEQLKSYYAKIKELKKNIKDAKLKKQEIVKLLTHKNTDISKLKNKIKNPWIPVEERDAAFKVLQSYHILLSEMSSDSNAASLIKLQHSLEQYKNRDVIAEANNTVDMAMSNLNKVKDFLEIIQGSIDSLEYMKLKKDSINIPFNLKPPILYQIAVCKTHLNKLIAQNDEEVEEYKRKLEELDSDTRQFKSAFKHLFGNTEIVPTLLNNLADADLSTRMKAACKLIRVRELINSIDDLSDETHLLNSQITKGLSEFENAIMMDLDTRISSLITLTEINSGKNEFNEQRKIILQEFKMHQENLRNLLQEEGTSDVLKEQLRVLDDRINGGIEYIDYFIKADIKLEEEQKAAAKQAEEKEIKLQSEQELIQALNEVLTQKVEAWGHHIVNGVTVIIDDGTKSGKKITVSDGVGEMIRILHDLKIPSAKSKTDFFRKAPVDLRKIPPLNQDNIVKNIERIQQLAASRTKWKLGRSGEARKLHAILTENLKPENLATPEGLRKAAQQIRSYNTPASPKPSQGLRKKIFGSRKS